MKKDYFLQFDYWNHQENQFWYGIVTIDLNEINLTDYCHHLVINHRPDIDIKSITLKINAFNLI